MAISARSPRLPKAALYLAIGAAVLIGGGIVVGLAGAIAAVLWRPLGVITSGAGVLAMTIAPLLAVAALVVGHVSRRRYPTERAARTGLIIAYLTLGSIAVLGVVGLLTWLSIR
jgi:hypothetical protein